jgi:Transposase IS66 family
VTAIADYTYSATCVRGDPASPLTPNVLLPKPPKRGNHGDATGRHVTDPGLLDHCDQRLLGGLSGLQAGCWAHVRRKFFDVHPATASPIANEALERIGQLYAVERTINGSSPEQRQQQRHLRSKPVAEALAA